MGLELENVLVNIRHAPYPRRPAEEKAQPIRALPAPEPEIIDTSENDESPETIAGETTNDSAQNQTTAP